MLKIYEKGVYVYIEIDGKTHRALKSKVEILPKHDEINKYSIHGFKDISPKETYSIFSFVKQDGTDFTNNEEFDTYTANFSIDNESIDFSNLLNSIDIKVSNLATIVTKLTSVDNKLTSIKNDTELINTNLSTLIQKATDQITELQGIKGELVAGNLKLDQIVIKLTNIDTNISSIKTDISAIKTAVESIDAKLDDVLTKLTDLETLITQSNSLLSDILNELNVSIEIENYEKNNNTINYIQKDTILWNNETGTQISKTTEYSINGINWTSTAPAGDVNLGFINWARDTFQIVDSNGNNVGTEQEVIKVVVLNPNCVSTEISVPIVEAINNQKIGQKQDFITWKATSTQILTIPANTFYKINLCCSKGEFKIANSSYDFASIININGGNLLNFIEISSDGISSEATNVSNIINMDELDPTNAYTITCVRDGVLSMELIKK